MINMAWNKLKSGVEDFDEDLADYDKDISTSGLHAHTYFQSSNPNKLGN